MTIYALTATALFVVSEDLVRSTQIVVGQGATFTPDRQQLAAAACARHPFRRPLQTFAQSVHDRLIQALAGAFCKQVGQRVGLRMIDR